MKIEKMPIAKIAADPKIPAVEIDAKGMGTSPRDPRQRPVAGPLVAGPPAEAAPAAAADAELSVAWEAVRAAEAQKAAARNPAPVPGAGQRPAARA